MANTCNGDAGGYSGSDDKFVVAARGQQRFLSGGLYNYTYTSKRG